ncbi:hypothetical protein SAMN05518672_101257 [Chitinophaga sp. CF118]|uniref:PKD domain-containing protein n=1 Tax=Chitinophaga sp. CF118 TaxID=1884367 RepID=UPI0008E12D38|nr:T9SS type A sorting domain-containing protein [Chitinophaga sp. CF118]SFD05665.1 hypothetical protein SAMN05518672_101257 [Chitinophaga sp. CF118]
MKNLTIRRLLLSVSLTMSIFYPCLSRAQGDQTQITVNIAPGATTGAWLHLPDDYDSTSTRYPLIIFLHGLGLRGTNVNVVLNQGMPKIIAQGAKMQFIVGGKLFKFITVSPQIPTGLAGEDMLQSILDDIKSKYRIDVSRIYFTGYSAGGYGVLNYAASGTNYSKNLAAIVPVSTAPIDTNKLAGLCNIATSNIATWFLCGSRDTFINNQNNYVDRINACNPESPVIATSYAGDTHNYIVWDKAYDVTHTYQSPNIYEWMLNYRRPDIAEATPPPIATKRRDKITITLPEDSLILDGSSLIAPDSRIVSYAWKLVSGHPISISSSTNTAKITVRNLIFGTYKFRLTVKDAAGITSTAYVTVLVNPVGGAVPGCSNCKFLLTPGADGGSFINGDSLNVQPGDTVCIHAGNYKYLQLFNFTGTEAKPIIFINCGGQVKVGNGGNYGLIFNNVKYFKVTGSGTTDQYGFVINGVRKQLNVGLGMGKGCTDFEAERFEISGSEVGVMAKVNPDCDRANQYPYFAMRNVKLHDIYVHDVSGEGIYIGNTLPNGIKVTCADSTEKNVLPPRIYNLRVYNITTANTGYDGIQVASAPENVEIYNNSVLNYGVRNIGSQQAGIILGGETNGKVYNNSIIKGTGSGIEILGIGLCYVYNNIISDAGIDGTPQKKDALFIDDRPTKNNFLPLHVNVFNNTFVNYGRDAIRFMNSYGTVARKNLFYNNLLVNPDLRALNIVTGINYTASNNRTYANIAAVRFSNANAKDFHLALRSPVLNKGKNLSAYFRMDIDGEERPLRAAYDIGADEYDSGTIKNLAPVSVAGSDTKILLPVSTTTLDGTASSDPDGKIISYAWMQVSGPVVATIASATTAMPVISMLTTKGNYVFELIVTDNKGAVSSDRLSVILLTEGPLANAGRDKTIIQPRNSSDATGAASMDNDGNITDYNWTQISGPTIASIVTPTAVKTDLNRLTSVGTYIFQLKITNSKGSISTDDLSVYVKPNPANLLFAIAGADQTINYPSVSKVRLDGSASYATNRGYISYYVWTKVSGPEGESFVNSKVENPVVKFRITGTYVFRLTVTDTYNNTATDDVSIIVGNTGTKTDIKISANLFDVTVSNAPDTKIYPNPVVSTLRLNLRLNMAAPIVVRIINSSGKIKGTYYLGTITTIQKDIDVSNLAAGPYILQIRDDKNLDLSNKFIKSN